MTVEIHRQGCAPREPRPLKKTPKGHKNVQAESHRHGKIEPSLYGKTSAVWGQIESPCHQEDILQNEDMNEEANQFPLDLVNPQQRTLLNQPPIAWANGGKQIASHEHFTSTMSGAAGKETSTHAQIGTNNWGGRTESCQRPVRSRKRRPFKLFYKNLKRTHVQQRLASRSLNEANYTYYRMSGNKTSSYLSRYFNAASRALSSNNYPY